MRLIKYLSGVRVAGRGVCGRGLRSVVVAAGVTAAVALAGCSGGSDNGGLPTYTPGMGGTTSSSATPSHPVPPTPLGYTPADPDKIGNWVVTAPFRARNAEEQRVVEAWNAFAQALVVALNQRTIDFKVLDRVATGDRRGDLLNLIGLRVQRDMFTVGSLYLVIESVQVRGDTAVVTYCQDDQSYEVDSHGKVVRPAPRVAAGRDTLIRFRGTWRVSEQKSTPGGCATPVPGR